MSLENREEFDVDLGKYLRALKRRALLGFSLFGLGMVGFTFLAFSLPSTYVAEGKLLFRPTDKTTPWLGAAPETGELRSLLSNQSPLSTEIEILTSPLLLQGVINRLQLTDAEGLAIELEAFRENVGVEIAGATDIIQISYQHPEAVVAAQVVNAIMDSYIQEKLEQSRAETEEVRDFIASKLPQLETNLLKAESDLRLFKEQYGIVDLSEETLATAKTLETLNQQTTAIAANLNGLKAQSQKLGNKLGLNLSEAIAINIASQSPEVRGALEELAVVEKDLAEQRKYYQDRHWSVAALKDKKSLLEGVIDDQVTRLTHQGNQVPKGLLQLSNNQENIIKSYIEIETQQLSLNAQLETLSQARSSYRNRASILPKLEETQRQLQRKLEVAQNAYSSLFQKFQDVQIAENKPSSNAEIMSPALVPTSNQSGKIMVLALGVITSLLLATLGVLIAEILDQSIKSLDEIKSEFNYPVLGIIPSFTKAPTFLIDSSDEIQQPSLHDHYSHSYLRDIYWMMQANLKSVNAHRTTQVIVVTSSVKEEGKSVVAANLALAISSLKDRVLLIDADLRQPCQNKIWKTENSTGLNQALLEHHGELTHTKSLNDTLELLTAGPRVADPLPLLDSSMMHLMIENARKAFDYIIIDAPPITPMADSLALGRMSDGFIFVSRPHLLDRRSAEVAKELLEKQQKVVLGLVVNGLSPKESIRISDDSAKEYRIKEVFAQDASNTSSEISKASSSLASRS